MKRENDRLKPDKYEFDDEPRPRGPVRIAVDTVELAVGGVLRLILRTVVTLILVFLCSGLLFACIFAYYVKNSLSADLVVTLEEVSLSLSSTIYYTDINGHNRELVTLRSSQERLWVDYDHIPQDMINALVAIEDKRFYKHKGVDWYRTVGAFGTMFLQDNSSFGGSTITQQLIKNTTHNDDVTVQRKLLEIFQALELEKNYTKEEILEWYLNVVNFGGSLHGVQTAAQNYFGKDVWELSLAECASIVGITNNPSKYNPFGSAMIKDYSTGESFSNREWNKKRQELILYEMYEQGYITYQRYQEAVAEELNFVRAENEETEVEIYTYYEETVINDVLQDLMASKNINIDMARSLLYNGGYQIYCCLDPGIQEIVDDMYQHPDKLPQAYYHNTSQNLQSAIVVMEPYTGKIVATSGGVGERTGSFDLNRATGSQRPAGSSIKPLASYGPAMEYGLITQNTLVSDAPGIKLRGRNDGWYPTNSPNTYDGTITIRTALQKSKNTVAAQIIDKLTPAVSFDFLTERLGFTSLVEADRDYAPLALGEFTNGVTVREMCQAYCSFVNEGVFTYSRTYTLVTDSAGNVVLDNQPRTIDAFSPNTAANMCDMLKNAVAKGTGIDAYFSGVDVGGKTGTTSANNDRYFCGITPYYVAAVWTGYDIPVTMYFKNNPAAVIWKTIMQEIHEGLEYKSFPVPVVGTATSTFGLTDYTPRQYDVIDMQPEETPSVSPTPDVDTEDNGDGNADNNDTGMGTSTVDAPTSTTTPSAATPSVSSTPSVTTDTTPAPTVPVTAVTPVPDTTEPAGPTGPTGPVTETASPTDAPADNTGTGFSSEVIDQPTIPEEPPAIVDQTLPGTVDTPADTGTTTPADTGTTAPADTGTTTYTEPAPDPAPAEVILPSDPEPGE